MGSIHTTTNAVVRTATANQRYIYAVESENPETNIAKELRNFLETLGYSNLFPNFDKARVLTVHPFAMLLAQEVLKQDQNVNVFPSITVSDSNLDQDAEVLADNYGVTVWNAVDVAGLGGQRQEGKMFVSDDGWAAINAKIDADSEVIVVERMYHTMHNVDFNIWSENKDVTSFLFDMVCHFISQKRIDLRENYGYTFGKTSGRRTGDINLDYGSLLYGANVTGVMGMNHRALLFDTAVSSITEVDTQTLPTYFRLQGV